jgi:hypothetical protein
VVLVETANRFGWLKTYTPFGATHTKSPILNWGGGVGQWRRRLLVYSGALSHQLAELRLSVPYVRQCRRFPHDPGRSLIDVGFPPQGGRQEYAQASAGSHVAHGCVEFEALQQQFSPVVDFLPVGEPDAVLSVRKPLKEATVAESDAGAADLPPLLGGDQD